ncbi:hypothetical protein ACO34A_13530 [Rhizobium sp. ACO-34A]|nr:AsmA family protein [Rhizobium sp. ACO-34A]ATN34820.1 hypothetical protein ACO34A_13530 [Rhizobium sp. ACO-34A]
MIGRLLVFLGGLLVVALFAALLGPMFVDWTDFRKDFEDQASRILGKKVTVHGAVNARLLPFPSVTLHDVTVGPDSEGAPLVTVSRFSLDAELAPFLSGEARIFDMRIEEPKARIRLLADGTLDWLRGSSAEIPARTVVLEKVHVTGGEIEFIDQQSGRTRKVSGLDAEMAAASLAGPWTADGNAVVDGEAGGFHLSSQQPNPATGAIPLKLRLDPGNRPFSLDLEGDLSLVEGKPIYKGRFQGQWRDAYAEKVPNDRKPVPAPRAKGEFELTNERIVVPEYRLELAEADNPYVITGEAKLDTGAKPEFLLTAEGQQVDVNRLANDGGQGKTGRNAAGSVRQRLNLLIAMAADIPVPTVPGRANLKLPAIVAGDTVLRDIQIDIRPAGTGWTVERAAAVLPGRTQVEAKGKLTLIGSPSFSGDLLVASTQPSGLASWVSGAVDPAIRQLKSAGFSAAVNLTPDMQRFEKLELAIGDAHLNGRLERESLRGQPATLSVDLSGNEIDLDAARALGALIVGDDLDNGVFAQRIATRMKVGKLVAYGVESHEVDTIFTLDSGSVSVERLNIGDVAGASIRASGAASGSLLDYTGKAQIAFQAADPTPFLTMAAAQLPPHPALAWLVKSAPWYADANVQATVSLGDAGGSGLTAKLSGTANGSTIAVDYAVDDIADFTGTASLKMNATLENPETQILLGQAGLDPLPIGTGVAGRLALDVSDQGGEAADVALQFTSAGTEAMASGQVSLDIADFLAGAGKVSVKSDDLEPFLMTAGVAMPAVGGGLPAQVSADVKLADRKTSFDRIEATLDGNAVTGALALDLSQAQPKIEGQLKAGHADLTWLAETVLGPVADPATGKLSQEVLPARVSEPDLDIALEIGSFSSGVFDPVTGLSATLRRSGGELTLDDINGSWFGGTLMGRLMVANADGTGLYQSRITLEGGDLADALPEQREGGQAAATGRFDFDLVAEASGKTVSELLGATNGSGSLKVGALTVSKLNLGLLPQVLEAADGIKGEITEDKVKGIAAGLIDAGPGTFQNVAVPFNITGGVMRIQNVTLESQSAKLDGEARLNLIDGTMDGTAHVALNAGDDALAGAEPGIRLTYAGEIGAPTRQLDVGDLTNFLSLRAFERERRRVEALQSNVLEKQRLRREVVLHRYREEERQKAEAERARVAEEARQKAEEAERLAAEEEARRAAQAASEGASAPETQPPGDGTVAAPEMPVSPDEKVTRDSLPPARPLQFDSLPGVN